MNRGTKFFLFGVLPFIIFVILSLIFGKKSVTQTKVETGQDDVEIYSMSQLFVERALKAPSTAEFPTTSHANITKEGNIYKVSCFVDAQNSFGAMIRSNYYTEMSYDSASENWTLLDIRIE